jgi:hypothetical protein
MRVEEKIALNPIDPGGRNRFLRRDSLFATLSAGMMALFHRSPALDQLALMQAQNSATHVGNKSQVMACYQQGNADLVELSEHIHDFR